MQDSDTTRKILKILMNLDQCQFCPVGRRKLDDSRSGKATGTGIDNGVN